MAAMEYGQECYCGSQLYKVGGAGVAVDASQCNMPCSGKSVFFLWSGIMFDTDTFKFPGNSAQLCGAGWRANLYLKAGTTLS